MKDAKTPVISHRTIREMGVYQEISLEGIDSSVVIQLWSQMLRLRRIEEALHQEYHPADEMRCPIHFCIGQESIPAALSLLLSPDDYLFSHHRSHGYYFAKNAPIRELFAEIYGKETGANGGKAGSQDISHAASRFYSGAILAGGITLAVGAAMGIKIQKLPMISVSGFGEGATDEGAFWEAVSYAGANRLPMLFVCENNRYATFSDQLKRQASDNISERVRTFGVPAQQIFGNDVALAYRTLKEAILSIQRGEGPLLIEAYTFRWNSHVGPEDDGANAYRSAEEMRFWKENCPIRLLEEKLRTAGILTDSLKSETEAKIQAEISSCFEFAKKSPFPSGADWRLWNWEEATPLADKFLKDEEEGAFNQYQADAKLGPY